MKHLSGDRALRFNNAMIDSNHRDDFSNPLMMNHIGPLVDRGALYSAIAIVELAVVASCKLPTWNAQLEPVTEVLDDCRYWKYCVGYHASKRRRIIASILLLCDANNDFSVWIRHLVLDGNSQWVIGQMSPNLKKMSNWAAEALASPS